MDRIGTVGIVGAGALGLMYACQIADKLGRDSVLILADEDRLARYRAEGLWANGVRRDFRLASTTNPTGETVDLLLFCTKYTTLADAAAPAGAYAHGETIALSVLNGVVSEAVIGDALGYDHLLYCEVHGMDATKEGANVTYGRVGTIVFGDGENRPTADVAMTADFLRRAEIPHEVPEDIHLRLWSKLMLNCGINQVTAIYGMGYGGVQAPGPARDLMVLTMEEARQVAALEGIPISRDEIARWLTVTDALSPTGRTSLCQDILAGRPTEVELFGGTVRALGRKHGVPTPLNDFLYDRIRELEANRKPVNNL